MKGSVCIGKQYSVGGHKPHEMCLDCQAISVPVGTSDFYVCCRCFGLVRYRPKARGQTIELGQVRSSSRGSINRIYRGRKKIRGGSHGDAESESVCE